MEVKVTMFQYYDENKLSPNGLDQLVSIKTHIGNVINNKLQSRHPDNKLLMYGSSLNGFGNKDCDVDCCLRLSQIPEESRQRHDILEEIKEHLRKMGPSNPVLQDITLLKLEKSPLPVLKCTHKRHEKPIDISVNTTSGVISTFLMRKYNEYDDVIAKLCLLVKEWRSKQDLWLTSTACVLLVINFLQVKGYIPVFYPNDPVKLTKHAGQTRISWNELKSGCNAEIIEELEQMMLPDGDMSGPLSNLFTYVDTTHHMPPLDQLLTGFFNYYCPKYGFRQRRITVRSKDIERRPKSRVDGEPILVQEPVSGTNAAAETTGSYYLKLLNEMHAARNILNSSIEYWEDIFLTRKERRVTRRRRKRLRRRQRLALNN